MALNKAPRHAVRSLQQVTRSFSTIVDDRLSSIAGSPLPRAGNVLQEALNATAPRHNWSRDEIREIYNTPLMELAHQSVSTLPIAFSRRTIGQKG